MIAISQLDHAIAGTPVLNSVTAQIPRGQITALVGPNGAGKSTLFSVIARLVPQQSGTVLIANRELKDWDSAELARHLAVLPQRMQVSSRLSVRDLVGFGRYPHNRGRPGPDCLSKRDDAIARFELETLADRAIDTLSGGQQQRAYLAMIYAQDTEYMLLDEPLNNLDIAAARSLMQHLRRLCDDHGRTIVIVLHDINVAARYADHLIALRHGAVLADGTPKDVITSRFMREVFGTDTSVHHIEGRPVVLV